MDVRQWHRNVGGRNREHEEDSQVKVAPTGTCMFVKIVSVGLSDMGTH